MNPSTILIIKPVLDQGNFLTICTEMLGYSPARKSDANGLKDLPQLISILSEFNKNSEIDTYDLLQFGFLIAADERDISEILEVASGMPFALTDTVVRGVQSIVLSGNLRQWIQAVIRGCRPDQPTTIRHCYNGVYASFCKINLCKVFNFVKHDMSDHTFYLTEDKRR